jgi:hypothetical protein
MILRPGSIFMEALTSRFHVPRPGSTSQAGGANLPSDKSPWGLYADVNKLPNTVFVQLMPYPPVPGID